jgi:hypothetical protein
MACNYIVVEEIGGGIQHVREELMKKTTSDELTAIQEEELAALADLPDEQINTQDAPELADWSEKKRGLFFRPVKQQTL